MHMRQKQHFIDLNQINNDTLNGLLSKAIFFAQNPSFPKPKTEHLVASLFMEPSTRTEMSFKIASAKLGFIHVDLNADRSSLKKGETFEETLHALQTMGVRSAIVRTKDENLLKEQQQKTEISLINAGSGTSHHPTQAMTDLLTIKKELGRTTNLKLAIIGDIKHSRVANSNIILHQKLGNELFLCAPNGFESPQTGKNIHHVDFQTALKEADVIMLLRVQSERHDHHKITKENYLLEFGMTKERLNNLRPEQIILHPGPFNRGVEIDPDILSDTRVKIWKQVENSIPMRMAILDWIINGETNEKLTN